MGKLNLLACVRHLEDLERIGDPSFSYTYDAQKGRAAVRFFELLPHTKGRWARKDPATGRRYRLKLEPWQAFIVMSLFGWVDVATGLRRFVVAYIEIPRKNGKTTLAAGVVLKMVAFDDEPGARVYCTATIKDQAKLCWGEARDMVNAEPALRKRLEVQDYTSTISHAASGSTLQPLGKDTKHHDGLNISAAVLDELHQHPTSAMVDVVATAFGSREQPIRFEITTAGDGQEGVCWAHHEYTRKVVERLHTDETWFGFIAHMDEKDDPMKEATWRKANPNWGVSVSPAYIRRQFTEAEGMPGFLKAVKRLHLNLWSKGAGNWLDMDRWDRCAPPSDLCQAVRRLKTWRKRLRGELCYAGLDLAATSDLVALVLAFPGERDADGKRDFTLLPWFFCPEETIELRSRRDKVPYDLWREEGLIIATEGDVTDYASIRELITGYTRSGEELPDSLADLYDIQEIAFDPWNASYLVSELQEDGAPMVEHRQGWRSMAAPTREFGILVKTGRLKHLAHPIMRWMASNIVVKTDPAGNMKPDRDESAKHGKIDGIVAGIMSVGRAIIAMGGDRSPYSETRGLTVL